jgi:hypothetical protein
MTHVIFVCGLYEIYVIFLITRNKGVRNFIESAFALPTLPLQLKKHMFFTSKETHDILID